MGKVIIGIHGLGNKPAREILSGWWVQSIHEGLRRIGITPGHFKFEMVYWADVFYDTPLDPLEEDPDNPLFLDEIYTPGPSNYVSDPHPVRQKLLDMLEEQLDNIFLNDDLTINFSFLTDTIIRNYFKELDSYYATEYPEKSSGLLNARDVIRERTADLIRKYRDDSLLVIGHSMGSIIAYDVLNFTIPDVEIDTFITMGSPLGLPVIMAKIAAERSIKLRHLNKLKTPSSVQRRWYNYSDLEDRIALIYNLTQNYDANMDGVKVQNFIVENDYSINGKKNPHKSFGYLRTPEFAGAICDFLGIRRKNLLKRWISNIKRNLKPIFCRNK